MSIERKRVTEEETKKMNQLLNSGMSKTKIAIVMGRSIRAVIEHTPKSGRKMQDPANVKIMLNMDKEGFSQREISENIGVSQATIYKYLNKHKPKEPKKKKRINPKTNGFVTPLNTPFY